MLKDGRVFVALGPDIGRPESFRAGQLYDPKPNEFRNIGKAVDPTDYLPYGHSSTLLPDGKVLLAGGEIAEGPYVTSTVNLFDPAMETFVVSSGMLTERAHHSATLLPSGEVLIAGGLGITKFPNGVASGPVRSTSEIYDPSTGSFRPAANMTVQRLAHTATLLRNGMVLMTGGMSSALRVRRPPQNFTSRRRAAVTNDSGSAANGAKPNPKGPKILGRSYRWYLNTLTSNTYSKSAPHLAEKRFSLSRVCGIGSNVNFDLLRIFWLFLYAGICTLWPQGLSRRSLCMTSNNATSHRTLMPV